MRSICSPRAKARRDFIRRTPRIRCKDLWDSCGFSNGPWGSVHYLEVAAAAGPYQCVRAEEGRRLEIRGRMKRELDEPGPSVLRHVTGHCRADAGELGKAGESMVPRYCDPKQLGKRRLRPRWAEFAPISTARRALPRGGHPSRV